MQKFIGTGVALVTPFNEDKSVDFIGLEKLVNLQIDNGVEYLVVLGTTGEPATLSASEKEAVIEKIVTVNNKRLPLMLERTMNGRSGRPTTSSKERKSLFSLFQELSHRHVVQPIFRAIMT